MKEDLKEHEQDCNYQEFHCADLSCREKTGMVSYFEHFQAKHLANIPAEDQKTGPKNTLTMNCSKFGEGSSSLHFIVWSNLSFFNVCRVMDGTIYFWMYILETKSEAKNFDVKYVFEGKGQRVKLNSAVFSLAVNKEEIMSQNMLFTVPLTMAKAIGDSGTWNYTVHLRNLKQEAKDEDVESGISDAE